MNGTRLIQGDSGGGVGDVESVCPVCQGELSEVDLKGKTVYFCASKTHTYRHVKHWSHDITPYVSPGEESAA